MKSPRCNHRPKRSRWAHCNTPEALRRRRAQQDARREALAATLPPVYAGPAPLSLWQTVLVLGADGSEHQRIELHVPADGSGARCDQHASRVDGKPQLLTATQVGRLVAAAIRKRPSRDLLAELRSAGA